MNDAELGALLTDLAGDLDLPESNLVDSVLEQIEAEPAPRRGGGRRWLVAAVVAAVFAISVVVIEPSREAMASWLGIGSTRIERVPDADLPENPSLPDLGIEIPVEPGDSPLPALGSPDAVFVDDRGVRSYVWAATEGLPAVGETDVGAVLSVRSAASEAEETKLVGEDDRVEAVRVGDADGLWLPAEHVLLGADGTPTAADRVLLWVSGGTEYRLETNLDKSDAVALGTQVEGTPTD